jgi:hypothetical protein
MDLNAGGAIGMTPTAEQTKAEFTPRARCKFTRRDRVRIRIAGWALALGLGAAQAWAVRFTMNPDGISYLDIGDASWRHDWHNAVNAYWSPLYSWILGSFINVIRPTPYWEYPLVHLVNFVIYIAAFLCFDYFLQSLSADRAGQAGQLGSSETALPEWFWWTFGYSVFLMSSLFLVGLSMATPDMLVLGFFYLASALLLRIRAGGNSVFYFALGLTLGAAYLAKAVMFPLAFVFLTIALFAKRPFGPSLRCTLLAAVVFGAVAGPLVTAISIQKKTLTFGESGSWNYRFYVNHMRYWPSGVSAYVHPVRTISVFPRIYEFERPIVGTFPLWYDPTYWHEGINPRFSIKGVLERIGRATILYSAVFFLVFLHVFLGLLALYWNQREMLPDRFVGSWVVSLAPLSMFAIYAVVHAEPRFIAAPCTVLLLVLCSGAVSAKGQPRPVSMNLGMFGPTIISILALVHVTWDQHRCSMPPRYYLAASALHDAGIGDGDRIALIWNEQWGSSAADGAIVPRLVRARIVAEMPDANGFWTLDPAIQDESIKKFRSIGVKAILSKTVPDLTYLPWKRLASTQFFVLKLREQPL